MPMSEDIRTDVGQMRRLHPGEFIMLISAFVHLSQRKFQPKGIIVKDHHRGSFLNVAERAQLHVAH